MEISANIPITIYFNSSIIKTAEEGMAFVCDEPILHFVIFVIVKVIL